MYLHPSIPIVVLFLDWYVKVDMFYWHLNKKGQFTTKFTLLANDIQPQNIKTMFHRPIWGTGE